MRDKPQRLEKEEECNVLVPYEPELKVNETSEHLVKPKQAPKQKVSTHKAEYKGLDLLPVKSSFCASKPLPPRPQVEFLPKPLALPPSKASKPPLDHLSKRKRQVLLNRKTTTPSVITRKPKRS